MIFKVFSCRFTKSQIWRRGGRQTTLKKVSPTDQRDDGTTHARTAPLRTAPQRTIPHHYARTHTRRHGSARSTDTHEYNASHYAQPECPIAVCPPQPSVGVFAHKRLTVPPDERCSSKSCEYWKFIITTKCFILTGQNGGAHVKGFRSMVDRFTKIVWIPPPDRCRYFGVIVVASQTHTRTISYFLQVANPCRRRPTATRTRIIIVFHDGSTPFNRWVSVIFYLVWRPFLNGAFGRLFQTLPLSAPPLLGHATIAPDVLGR